MFWEFLDSFFLEFISQLGIWVGAGFGGLVVYHVNKLWIRYKENKRRKHSSIPLLNNIDISVYKYLAEALAESGADRAYVVQFHNGIFYVNAASQMKMSCTHEMVETGVSKEQEVLQGLVISHYPEDIHRIIHDGVPVFDTSVQDPTKFVQMLRERGSKLTYVAAMREEDVLEGFVAMDFNKYEPGLEDSTTVKSSILDYAQKIGYLLRGAK